MIKIFTLPANEGDFIWICYGENEMYNHILIDGGPKECGEEYASIINIIDERKEKIEALVLTHVDYDHIQGAILLSGKLNDAPSGRLFRADFRTLQMCQSL